MHVPCQILRFRNLDFPQPFIVAIIAFSKRIRHGPRKESIQRNLAHKNLTHHKEISVKHWFLSGVALLAVTACGGENTAQNPADKTTASESSPPTTKAAASAPELGAWGVSIGDIDDSVKPGDDFYQHVNGKWLDSFEIPDDFSNYGSFTVLFERSEDRVKAIIEDAAKGNTKTGSAAQKIGDYFASFLDTDAINAAGLTPLADSFAQIASIETAEDVAIAMTNPAAGVNSLFAAFVGVDAKQPDRYITYLTQSGLGMPNRNYYVDEKFADKSAKYKEYIARVFTLAEIDGASEKADAVYALETKIAEAHWEPAKRRNRDLTYNLKTIEELSAFAPDAPWQDMMNIAGLGDATEVVVREDDAIQNLATILATTPVETWKDYLTFHLIRSNSAVLPLSLIHI